MFGMGEPGQALLQLERYHNSGRDELAEVMCSQFVESFLSKKCDVQEQIHLVKGLRLLSSIYYTRDKLKEAQKTLSSLHKRRNKLHKIIEKQAPQLLEKMTSPAEDYRLQGKVMQKTGKLSKAAKSWSMVAKFEPLHLAGFCEAVLFLGPEKGRDKRLLDAVNLSGPVMKIGDVFRIEPENKAHIGEIAQSLVIALRKSNSSDCKHKADSIEAEIQAIISGEQAENARLQAAIDKLDLKVDYYEYG